MAEIQCILAFRHSQDDLLVLKPSIRMGKKCNLNDFEFDMVIGARWAGLVLLIY